MGMRYSTGTSFPFSSTASQCQEWDPEIVFELNNPLKGCVTCVGHAPSQGRRCQNRVAAQTIAYALAIMNKLATKSASEAAASPQLETVAPMLLCKRWHQNQASVMAQRWRFQLEDWAARHEDVKSESQASDQESDTGSSDSGWGGSDSDDSDDGDVDDDDNDNDRDNKSDIKDDKDIKREDEKPSIDELMKTMKQMQDSLDRLNAKLRERDVKVENEVKRDEEERRKRKAEEKEKIKRQQEEERRRRQQQQEEEERKRREEKARKQEEERRRREAEAAAAAAAAAEARARAFQERVRQTRERWEREKQDQASREAAEWRAAWERYSRQWEGGRLSTTNIPWPVKSGLWWEVNEASVRLFFARAPPEELRATARRRVAALNGELRRWHTDKVVHHLGAEFANSFVKSTLDTVARVLVELRQEAQAART